MMNVYVVLKSTKHGLEQIGAQFCGVYTSLTQAQNRIAEIRSTATGGVELYIEEINLLGHDVIKYGN